MVNLTLVGGFKTLFQSSVLLCLLTTEGLGKAISISLI